MSDKISPKEKSQILDFSKFKKKKETENTFARGRKPLYVSHLKGKISGEAKGGTAGEDENFADRLERIKASLERINSLMSELKKMSNTSRDGRAH